MEKALSNLDADVQESKDDSIHSLIHPAKLFGQLEDLLN